MSERSLKSRKSSVLWNYFTPLGNSIGLCSICGAKISYKSTISNMKKHLESKHHAAQLSLGKKQRVIEELEESGLEFHDVDEGGVEIEVMDGDEIEEIDEINTEVPGDRNASEPHENNSQELDTETNNQTGNTSTPNIQTLKVERVTSLSKSRNFHEPKTSVNHHYKKNFLNVSKPIAVKELSVDTNKPDMYDHFGKYIASVLREVGPPAALTLQEEITRVVMRKMCLIHN